MSLTQHNLKICLMSQSIGKPMIMKIQNTPNMTMAPLLKVEEGGEVKEESMGEERKGERGKYFSSESICNIKIKTGFYQRHRRNEPLVNVDKIL